MKRAEYPPPIRQLIAELKRMPGIGPRSAERIALWMIQSPDAHPAEIARTIESVTQSVHPCPLCGFFTTEPHCQLCTDPLRDPLLLCVVEQPTDILPIERTGAFPGRYHTLGGRISPLDHIGPDDLRIDSLLQRTTENSPTEIILALGADVEGEATANYLVALLRHLPITLTRLAQGMPAGSGLEYADELTLTRAMSGRTRLH